MKREKVVIVLFPNFVTKTQFHPLPDDQKMAFVSSLVLIKMPLSSLALVKFKNVKVSGFIAMAKDNPDWTFVWVGGFSFGSITAGYDELKKVLANPPANLKFPGIVDRAVINGYYNVADVFLLPSYTELFPMSAF